MIRWSYTNILKSICGLWGDNMAVKFYDYKEDVKSAMASSIMPVLEECCGELESAVKRNTVVKTGQTKNSWRHVVSESGGEYVGVVGSDYDNAIWEEFGTGEYALNGDGRKGGWAYYDEKGVRHFTFGKRPRRPFYNAYTAMKSKLINRLQTAFKGGLS